MYDAIAKNIQDFHSYPVLCAAMPVLRTKNDNKKSVAYQHGYLDQDIERCRKCSTRNPIIDI